MTAKPVYVASDVHLGATAPAQETAFGRWLEHAAAECGHIVLNGDLFDFWFEYRSGTTGGHERILRQLRRIVCGGVPITLVGGNHDWWGGRFLTEEIGLEFLHGPVVRELGGLRAFLAHGDGLGRGDVRYRIMRRVLRARWACWAFSQLPPHLGDRLARGASRTHGRWAKPSDRQLERGEALEEWAHGTLRKNPDLDLVILGHAHVPALKEVSPGRWYLNAGDWVYRRTYAVLAESSPPRLLEWTTTP